MQTQGSNEVGSTSMVVESKGFLRLSKLTSDGTNSCMMAPVPGLQSLHQFLHFRSNVAFRKGRHPKHWLPTWASFFSARSRANPYLLLPSCTTRRFRLLLVSRAYALHLSGNTRALPEAPEEAGDGANGKASTLR